MVSMFGLPSPRSALAGLLLAAALALAGLLLAAASPRAAASSPSCAVLDRERDAAVRQTLVWWLADEDRQALRARLARLDERLSVECGC